MKAFKMSLNTARMRVKRLQKDGAIEKCGEIIENGGKKFVYKKKGALIF
jgi:predicted transcriptional regulator